MGGVDSEVIDGQTASQVVAGERGTGERGPLILESVTKAFGALRAVDDVSLTVHAGEALVLLGPSGCGKTTTLRLIAGFERPDNGRITLGGRHLANDDVFVQPEHRDMAVVFQSYALWPHMTVDQNVGFGPSLRDGKRKVGARVAEALEMVRLEDLGHRYPHELSGGQQQRVALARALVTRPEVLLLDEPMSNLDTQLREDMRFEVKRLQRELRQTMIYVTHDQAEALSLADRVAVLREGRIEQLGTPQELYDAPRTSFVARALGATNVLTGRVTGGDTHHCSVLVQPGVTVQVPPNGAVKKSGDDVMLSVRPGAVELLVPEPGTQGAGLISEALFVGESIQYVVQLDGGESMRVVTPGRSSHTRGDRVSISVNERGAALIDD